MLCVLCTYVFQFFNPFNIPIFDIKMNNKKWYKKKRYWCLFLLVIIFFAVRMEWAKMRYDQDALLFSLQEKGILADYDTRKSAGKTIHFLQTDKRKDLPVVVMMHGSPGALNAYEEYFSDTTMTKQAIMIAVDRPGFGYSDFGKSEPSLAIQAELIAEILKDFPNQKKILAGHSMGGPVISKLAMDFPELVDGMIMVAPSISPELEPSNGWRKVLDFPLIRWFTPGALRVCNQEIIPLKEELNLMMSGWKNIVIPVTVIQGEEDPLVPMGNALFAASMLDHNPDFKTIMIKGGDHFILWSETTLIKKEINRMLESMD